MASAIRTTLLQGTGIVMAGACRALSSTALTTATVAAAVEIGPLVGCSFLTNADIGSGKYSVKAVGNDPYIKTGFIVAAIFVAVAAEKGARWVESKTALPVKVKKN